jgi:hypothetical protein
MRGPFEQTPQQEIGGIGRIGAKQDFTHVCHAESRQFSGLELVAHDGCRLRVRQMIIPPSG